MSKSSDILLDSVFLKNRIAELGIKQWWLAEQIGVDRKTVIRWLQGRVKSIQISNAGALAQILGCDVKDLSLENEADQLATLDDQRNAALLISSSSLIERLGPIGEWDVIEALLKATLVPHLPLNILGELLNQLTVASWRQSKIDQADIYNRKAEDLAIRSGDKAVLAGALLSKANISSWRGQISRAIQTYRECLRLEKFIEARTLASTYSNLGAVLYESGDLNSGEECLTKAIEIFTFHGSPTNLSIAWCHLALLHLQRDNVKSASTACEKSISFALSGDYKRGSLMGELIRAEIHARKGDKTHAKDSLSEGLDGFSLLGIEEGLNYEFAGRVCRLLGELKDSEEYLRNGISISKSFPMYLASLHVELAKTLAASGKPTEAKRHAREAASIYKNCEAPLRSSLAYQLVNSID